MDFTTIDPTDGEVIQHYRQIDDARLDTALDRAVAAQAQWRNTAFGERSALLREAGRILEARSDKLARLAMREMGKPLAQGRAEVKKCAAVCEYYAAHAEALLARREVSVDQGRAYVDFAPLGVILAVMPWNFPFWQVFRCAAPTLAAGNGVVLKHAQNVTGCALAIGELVQEAGFPAGLFQTLLIDHAQAEAVIRDRRVAGVSLTGSVAAGRKVAAVAGEALKKCVLELGGSDAYLVLEDADLAVAAEQCAAGRLVNGGQSCVAAKRFIVADSVRESFQSMLLERLREARVGDPADPATTVGPLARVDLRDSLHAQVEQSIARGARCLLGGDKPDGAGAWYPVTLLADVRPGQPAYDEELFGPVAAVIAAKDQADALSIANDSVFGLGGAVFSRDAARAERIATAMDCGMVAINRQLVSDPRLPFGGVKDSGLGREIGEFGILEFVNIKTVTLA